MQSIRDDRQVNWTDPIYHFCIEMGWIRSREWFPTYWGCDFDVFWPEGIEDPWGWEWIHGEWQCAPGPKEENNPYHWHSPHSRLTKCPQCLRLFKAGKHTLQPAIPRFKGRELVWTEGIPFRTDESRNLTESFLAGQRSTPVCSDCRKVLLSGFQPISDAYEIHRLARRLKDESHARHARN